ncbi:MAG: VIT1/CCC1 transporter family protein [Myxococcota bacterium]
MAGDLEEEERARLEREHRPEAVQRRLARGALRTDLSDAVLGAIDGCVTTFAVVAGVLGAGLSPKVAILLGFANLVADGVSMAVSNYERAKSERERAAKALHAERRHMQLVPKAQLAELREIFRAKGFEPPLLDEVVRVLARDEELFARTVLAEEFRLYPEASSPVRAGLVTLAAFLGVGAVPLFPFMLPSWVRAPFVVSGVATALAFFATGALRGYLLERPVLRSGLGTLFTGGAAAALSFATAAWIRRWVEG